MAVIIAVVIIAIVVVAAVGMTSMSSYTQPEMDSDEYIQKLDQNILDKIDKEPGIETQISELHTCQKIQVYGNLLGGENDLRYKDGPYGDLKVPESDEQTKITQEFVRQGDLNKKAFDEQNCSDSHDTEWGTGDFYQFQSDLLESNDYFN